MQQLKSWTTTLIWIRYLWLHSTIWQHPKEILGYYDINIWPSSPLSYSCSSCGNSPMPAMLYVLVITLKYWHCWPIIFWSCIFYALRYLYIFKYIVSCSSLNMHVYIYYNVHHLFIIWWIYLCFLGYFGHSHPLVIELCTGWILSRYGKCAVSILVPAHHPFICIVLTRTPLYHDDITCCRYSV